MQVLIIEDELPAQRMLAEMLEEIEHETELVGCLNSVKSAVDWFNKNPHPDIVLLDIQLSDGVSFDILEQVQVQSIIIFTTAYDEYAIQAFKVNSLDYLLKPIDEEDLRSAFDKFEFYSNQFLEKRNEKLDYSEIASIIKNASPDYRKRFLLQSGESFIQLHVEDIAYIYSMQKVNFAVTFEKREYPLNFSLENLKEQLNPDTFFKINRQYIININAIRKIHSYFQGKLKLETQPKHNDDMIVGKDKAASFKHWLDR